MATVVISKKIITEVKEQIEEVFDKRERDLIATLPVIEIYREGLGHRIADHANELPDPIWCCRREDFILKDGKDKYTLYLPSKMAFPPVYQWSPPELMLQANSKFRPQVQEFRKKHAELMKEKTDLLESITGTMESCGTLRQLLEVWPSALDFMSEEVKTRHAAVPEKKPVREAKGLNDTAKALLLKTKIMK